MISEKIKEVYYVFKSSVNGEKSEVLVYSQDDYDSILAWKKIDTLKKPLINVGTCIVANCSRRLVNESGFVSVLPNNEDLIIILDKENKKFRSPNNAAIYNFDGTLKHQLVLPEGEESR